MTGRDLIQFILDNRMENADLIFGNISNDSGWCFIRTKNLIIKDGCLVFKYPEDKNETMNDIYGDGSDHICCPKCGFCATCGDCEELGCGENGEKQIRKKKRFKNENHKTN